MAPLGHPTPPSKPLPSASRTGQGCACNLRTRPGDPSCAAIQDSLAPSSPAKGFVTVPGTSGASDTAEDRHRRTLWYWHLGVNPLLVDVQQSRIAKHHFPSEVFTENGTLMKTVGREGGAKVLRSQHLTQVLLHRTHPFLASSFLPPPSSLSTAAPPPFLQQLPFYSRNGS